MTDDANAAAAIYEALAPLGWKRRDDPTTDAKKGRNVSTEVFECGDLRMTITIDRPLTREEEISRWTPERARNYLKTINASDPDFEFVTQRVKEAERRWQMSQPRYTPSDPKTKP